MLAKVLGIITLSAFVLLSAVMQSTSPSAIHPLGILLVFVLIYLLALGVLTFFIFGVSHFIYGLKSQSGRSNALTLKTAYYYASVLAIAPVMLFGVRSIGRTAPMDIALIVLFEIVACFYISKRR